MKFRLMLGVIVAVTAMVATNSASAVQSRQDKIQIQQKRFYHADGFIKCIGAVAHRTIYNSNPEIRHKWKQKLRKLISVRDDAREKIAALRAPPLPPHYSAWLCIHSHEGSWTDDGAPYYGGLQFGWNEWKTYGGKYASQANFATPLEQMWAAEAYFNVSGFSPWPQTARLCGLL